MNTLDRTHVHTDRALAAALALLSVLSACTSVDAPTHVHADAQARSPRLPDSELALRVERGRALLDAGLAREAEAVFTEAAAADGESLRTRVWILRAWMDQGRSNDTLDALDELDRELSQGDDPPMEITYLYGMAFARRAEGNLAQGITDSSVQMNFTDAKDFLEDAVRADPVRYRDAFLPLARAAWFEQDLETARWAADRAVEVTPGSSQAWLERGRILMAKFTAAEGEEPGGGGAEAFWNEAARSFQNAVEAAATPTDEAGGARLAEAATQLGHTMLWRQKGPEATEAYATAMAWNPERFDYGRTLEFLRGLPETLEDDRPNGFRAALELARERLEVRNALGDEGAATLLWWLGWARFAEADWVASEASFQEALAIAPNFANAWFYVGLARQYRRDSSGAVEAMRSGWDIDPASMVATTAKAGGALRAFEGLLGWCATQEPPRNLDAAFLAEMLANAMPEEARHWNNVGLFLRDEGERLEIEAHENKTPEPDPTLLADLYGRAFAAYQRALELTPDDPQLINDAALMLQYHVNGDAAEVEARYRLALERSDELLSSPALSAEDRARFEQTKKDIGINLKHLLEPEAEEPAPETPPDGAAQDTAAASASGGG